MVAGRPLDRLGGVVDQDVEPVPAVADRVDQAAAPRAGRGSPPRAPTAGRSHSAASGTRREASRGVAREAGGDQHLGPVAQQLQRGVKADLHAAAGDDRPPPGQVAAGRRRRRRSPRRTPGRACDSRRRLPIRRTCTRNTAARREVARGSGPACGAAAIGGISSRKRRGGGEQGPVVLAALVRPAYLAALLAGPVRMIDRLRGPASSAGRRVLGAARRGPAGTAASRRRHRPCTSLVRLVERWGRSDSNRRPPAWVRARRPLRYDPTEEGPCSQPQRLSRSPEASRDRARGRVRWPISSSAPRGGRVAPACPTARMVAVDVAQRQRVNGGHPRPSRTARSSPAASSRGRWRRARGSRRRCRCNAPWPGRRPPWSAPALSSPSTMAAGRRPTARRRAVSGGPGRAG